MTFNINTRDLLRVLSSAGKALAPKALMPAYECFLIENNSGTLKVTACNERLYITEKCACEGEDGKIMIHGKELMDLIKTLPDIGVTITSDEKQATVSWGKGHASLPLNNTTEYPTLERPQQGMPSLKYSAEQLKSAIAHVIGSCAEDELRPVMNGIYFDITPDKTTLVASNGHILSLIPIETGGACEPFILDKNAAAYIKEISDGFVTIAVSPNSLFIGNENSMVCVRRIDGRYPNYSLVIPKDGDKVLTMNKSSLIGVLRRVSTCTSKTANLIKLSLTASHCEIVGEDIDFSVSARETLECSYEGDDLLIGMNPAMMLSSVNAMTCEDITLTFKASNVAAVMTGDTSTTLLMPMIIQD